MDKLYTVEEVAELLHVSPGTLHNWNYRKSGPRPIKVGRRCLYPAGEVQRFITAAMDAA